MLDDLEAKNPEIILQLIENEQLEQYFDHQIGDSFMIALKKYEERGEAEEAKKMAHEIKLFRWSYSFNEKQFNICTNYNNEDIIYYKQRAKQTENDYLRAKYCDVIWDQKSEVEYVILGINSHLEISKVFFQLNKYHDMSVHSAKAFSLSKSIKNDCLQEKCLETHLEFVDHLKELKDKHYLSIILKSILENGYFIKDKIDLDLIFSLIKKNIEYCEREQLYDNQRLFLELEEKYYNLINDKSQFKGVLIKIIESYEKQADFYNQEGKNNILSARYYRLAIEKYQAIGGFGEKINILKLKLKNCLEEGVKKELFPIPMPDSLVEELEKDADEFVNHFQDKNVEEIIECLLSEKFTPSFKECLTNLSNPDRQAGVTDVIPVILIDEGLTIGSYSEDDLIEFNVIQNYFMNNQFFIYIKLTKLFQYIKKNFPNYMDIILSRIEQSDIIEKERLRYIDSGLIKFAENDFLSSIHILIFQIEGILRDLLIKLGEPPQKIMPNSDEFYSLGQIIDRIRQKINTNNQFLEIFKFIEVFLVDKRAGNIRNLIAHGYFPYGANNIGIAILLIFILLRLSVLSITKKK